MKAIHCIFGAILLLTVVGSAYAQGGTTSSGDGSSAILTEGEVANILHLREEEKLARDVYLALYNKWEAKIYLNISASEQTHMDAVEKLIVKYGLEDPVVDETSCVFTNEAFIGLCEYLIIEGEKSEPDGLRSGVAIEEMDIEDIQEMLRQTDKTDIGQVLANLLAGSYNHLAAFEKLLEKF